MDNAKYARLIYFIKWFLGVSLVFQLVGYFTPGWMHTSESRYNGEKIQYMLGLWYHISCGDDKCVSVPLSDERFTDMGLVGPQVETTLALFLCIVALYITHKKTNCNSTEEQQRVVAYIHMICCASSSILSITAVAIWITYSNGRSYMSSQERNTMTLPYSLLFTGLGGVLAGLAFLTNVIWRPWKHAPLPFQNPCYELDNPAIDFEVGLQQNTDSVYEPATYSDDFYP